MFRCLLLLAGVASGATLTISPSTIYSCANAHGEATIQWSGASGPVHLEVGPGRVPMTGTEPVSGKALATGWVSDGLQFFLVNEAGGVEAVATAHVQCGGAAADGSYFPLAVGNTWVYKHDSRAVTSDYVTYKVAGTQFIDGLVYFALNYEALGKVLSTTLLREDESGRLWQRSTNSETLLLNPALYSRTPYRSVLGDFPDSIFQPGPFALGTTDYWYARGIGMVKQASRLNSGSSGGFTDGLELVEVRLAGGLHLELPTTSLTLSSENRTLDVTGRRVTNCAIVCYFVACGIAGADPPGTYKPCTQARVKGEASTDFLTELELVNAASEVVYRAPAFSAPPGENVRYIQVPLYSSPNVPLPAGEYRLVGRLKTGDEEAASSEMTLHIE